MQRLLQPLNGLLVQFLVGLGRFGVRVAASGAVEEVTQTRGGDAQRSLITRHQIRHRRARCDARGYIVKLRHGLKMEPESVGAMDEGN